jgi:metal-responsive CopG/Arc/MetJ family transcriptional regulator
MKSSPAKKASISLPASLERELKRIAGKEHRTLSGVLQEAARYYISARRFEELQREVSLAAARHGVRSDEELDELVHAARREHP